MSTLGKWLGLKVGIFILICEIIFLLIFKDFFDDRSIIDAKPTKEAFALFISEILWRKSAAQNLTEKIDNYDLAIRDTIGLRLQSRLTKKQAKYVAKCRSVHRDISLNF